MDRPALIVASLRPRLLAAWVPLLLVMSLLPRVVAAQLHAPRPVSTWSERGTEPEPEPEPKPEPEPEPDSPRASVRGFLERCRVGDHVGAAKFLELPRGREADGPELARRLAAVLHRRMPFDEAGLSPRSQGERDDNLPRNEEEIGRIPLSDGSSGRVLLIRRARPEPRWLFSRATINRIDTWYAQLENYWLLSALPKVLLGAGPFGIAWWQWLVVPLMLIIATVVGWVLARIVRALLTRWVRSLDLELLTNSTRPLTMVWTLLIVYAVLPALGTDVRVEAAIRSGLHSGFLIVVFWMVAGAIDISSILIVRSSWGASNPSGRSLVPLARRTLKIAVIAIAFVAVVADLGYPVASMITGLGIGGLVLALAAQKTLENLFGTFSIGADQPFREGDYVRIEDFEGTVESIGLRSTRFRTLDRTLVTLPNGKLAEMRIESYSARDRMRMQCRLALVHRTSPEQLLAVLRGCEDVLRQHPAIWDEHMVVRLSNLGESALDIEVMAWFQTTDWLELRKYRHEVLIGFMRVVHREGTALAFPTRTIHIGSGTPPAP